MADTGDTLGLHQKDIGAAKLLTPAQERRMGMRVQAARKRYHLACLTLAHVARTWVGVLRQAQAGTLTAERVTRMAKTELLTPAQLAATEGMPKKREAEARRSLDARLAHHLPTCEALLARSHHLSRSGDAPRLAAARRKVARLLYEVGTKSAKMAGLVDEAAGLPPDEQGETAESLALAVAKCRRRRGVYEAAKGAMVRANLRLVHQQAKKMAGRLGVGKEGMADLIQDGYTGLIKAVDKFEVRYGNRFSTAAAGWIVQAMRKAVGDHGRTVKVPSHTRETAGLVYWARLQLAGQGREPTLEEVVAHIKRTRGKEVSVKQAAQADRAVQPVASYGSEDGEDAAGQCLADDEGPADEGLARSEASEAVLTALKVLPFRQREILKLRTGIGDGWKYGLEECGSIFGIGRERARQIQEDAMAALRQPGVMELLSGHV